LLDRRDVARVAPLDLPLEAELPPLVAGPADQAADEEDRQRGEDALGGRALDEAEEGVHGRVSRAVTASSGRANLPAPVAPRKGHEAVGMAPTGGYSPTRAGDWPAPGRLQGAGAATILPASLRDHPEPTGATLPWRPTSRSAWPSSAWASGPSSSRSIRPTPAPRW